MYGLKELSKEEIGVTDVTTQDKLYAAINLYGLSDIRTLKISQEREKEIIEEMKEVYGVK